MIRTLLALVICATSVFAQQIGNATTQEGVIPPRGTFAIRNARIITVSGPDIENGTIVIRDGKIEAVGANVSVPAGAQTIDGSGLSVYPGMIDAGTNLGLVEVPQGANGTVDLSEVGELNPNAKAITAVNPHSAHIAVTRVEGITNTLTAPTGGLISGQATVINLLGTLNAADKQTVLRDGYRSRLADALDIGEMVRAANTKASIALRAQIELLSADAERIVAHGRRLLLGHHPIQRHGRQLVLPLAMPRWVEQYGCPAQAERGGARRFRLRQRCASRLAHPRRNQVHAPGAPALRRHGRSPRQTGNPPAAPQRGRSA